MISSAQIRGARAMLKWSAKELAEKAGLSLPTVQRMENNNGVESALGKNLTAIEKALTGAGVEFLEGNGVRIKE